MAAGVRRTASSPQGVVGASLVGAAEFSPVKIVTPEWIEEAECGFSQRHLFYAPDGERSDHPAKAARIASAKAICAECPVRRECLEYARETEDGWAIMGGTTPEERRRERKLTDSARDWQKAKEDPELLERRRAIQREWIRNKRKAEHKNGAA
jgi:WhiB family transcriptional regulator, redox-sensing transcriptional regulator